MAQYEYSGPVMEFDRCIVNNWTGTTCATTSGKARSNLIYQFKRKNNRLPNARITLPGKLIRTGEDAYGGI